MHCHTVGADSSCVALSAEQAVAFGNVPAHAWGDGLSGKGARTPAGSRDAVVEEDLVDSLGRAVRKAQPAEPVSTDCIDMASNKLGTGTLVLAITF
jgi:hypothetical protein